MVEEGFPKTLTMKFHIIVSVGCVQYTRFGKNSTPIIFGNASIKKESATATVHNYRDVSDTTLPSKNSLTVYRTEFIIYTQGRDSTHHIEQDDKRDWLEEWILPYLLRNHAKKK